MESFLHLGLSRGTFHVQENRVVRLDVRPEDYRDVEVTGASVVLRRRHLPGRAGQPREVGAAAGRASGLYSLRPSGRDEFRGMQRRLSEHGHDERRQALGRDGARVAMLEFSQLVAPIVSQPFTSRRL